MAKATRKPIRWSRKAWVAVDDLGLLHRGGIPVLWATSTKARAGGHPTSKPVRVRVTVEEIEA